MESTDFSTGLVGEIASTLDVVGTRSTGFSTVAYGALPSWFDVTGLAAASVGAACAEISALIDPAATALDTQVDARLASFWFDLSIRPDGWSLPPVWDAVAGLYPSGDGWIRLHTNAPHHKIAALDVLGCKADREKVAAAVRKWSGSALESAIIDADGCAAQMRSMHAWAKHPQGVAVNAEPLIAWQLVGDSGASFSGTQGRPLAGLKVLDLTRVLAGPVATRFLAAFGADVLRIDPPGWDEGVVVPEVTIGKRCATLDLRKTGDRAVFEQLLREADVLVHGYRPDALEKLGLGDEARRALNPALIDVALSAYGWSGPWRHRRGFDSLVQMSSGIAELGMQRADDGQPTPLPVQALDQATGYLMAAAALRALRCRNSGGDVFSARVSLARTAALLVTTLGSHHAAPFSKESAIDLDRGTEDTDWGPAHRLRFPTRFSSVTPHWDIAAHDLHSHQPTWGK